MSDCGEQPASCRIDIITIELGAKGELIRLNLIENATDWVMTQGFTTSWLCVKI